MSTVGHTALLSPARAARLLWEGALRAGTFDPNQPRDEQGRWTANGLPITVHEGRQGVVTFEVEDTRSRMQPGESPFSGLDVDTTSFPGYLNVLDVAVTDSSQRQGIASNLYKRALDYAKERGYKGVVSISGHRKDAGNKLWTGLHRVGKVTRDRLMQDVNGATRFVDILTDETFRGAEENCPIVLRAGYDPEQPRDDAGRWTKAGLALNDVQDAIQNYTAGSESINDALRRGKAVPLGYAKDAETLDKAIALARVPGLRKVYRAVPGDVLDRYQHGESVIEQGYLSTSKNPKIVDALREGVGMGDEDWGTLEIIVPDSGALDVNAALPKNRSFFAEQDEVILPRGLRFYVQRMGRKVTLIPQSADAPGKPRLAEEAHPVLSAADRHAPKVSLTVRAAFAIGRRALRAGRDAGDAVERALGATLPAILERAAVAGQRAAAEGMRAAWDPDQPRDEDGKWTEAGAIGAAKNEVPLPFPVAKGIKADNRAGFGRCTDNACKLAETHDVYVGTVVRKMRLDEAKKAFEKDKTYLGTEAFPHAWNIKNGEIVDTTLGSDYASEHKYFGRKVAKEDLVEIKSGDELARWHMKTRVLAFDPDQPRDEQGRWSGVDAAIDALPTHDSPLGAYGYVLNPLPQAGERAAIAAWTDRKDAVEAAMRARGSFAEQLPFAEEVEVEIASLRSYQTRVHPTDLRNYARNRDDRPKGVIFRHEGVDWIVDGNHRLGVEMLAGEKRAKVLRLRGVGGEMRAAGEYVPSGFRTAKRRESARVLAARRWARKHAAELVVDIAETTRKRVREAVAEFGDLNEMIDRIAQAVGDEDRAETIARTESMRAAHEGQRQEWHAAIDEGYLSADARRVWITTPDDKLCPICEPLDGETAELDGEYAADITGSPAHPNCRCTEGLSF